MRTYHCFYNQKKIELTADDLYDAKVKAVQLFKTPKSKQHMVSVILADVPVNTASL